MRVVSTHSLPLLTLCVLAGFGLGVLIVVLQ